MVTRKIVRPSPTAIPAPPSSSTSVLPGFVRAGYVKGSVHILETEIERRARIEAEELLAIQIAKVARRRARSEERERREAQQEDEDRSWIDGERTEQRPKAGLSEDQANRAKFDNEPRNDAVTISSDEEPRQMQPMHMDTDSERSVPEHSVAANLTKDEREKAMKDNEDFRKWRDIHIENNKYFDAQDQAREEEKEREKANKQKKKTEEGQASPCKFRRQRSRT